MKHDRDVEKTAARAREKPVAVAVLSAIRTLRYNGNVSDAAAAAESSRKILASIGIPNRYSVESRLSRVSKSKRKVLEGH